MATLASLERSTASLASQVRAAEEEVRRAEQVARDLGADRAAAAQAETELGRELKRLEGAIPRLEADLKACIKAERDADRAYRESFERFQQYCREKDPVSDVEKEYVALVGLVRRGTSLNNMQRKAWDHIGPKLRDGIDTYLDNRDQLQADAQALATESARLVAKHQSLKSELVASRGRLRDGAEELEQCRQTLSRVTASSIANAEAVLAQKAASCDRLKTQLAAAESQRNAALATERRKAAEESRRLAEAARLRKAQADRATVVAAPPPATYSIQRHGGAFRNLRPGVRALILAEAAGLDDGLDIFPDDNPLPPIPTIQDALEPVAPVGPSSTIHADGLGVTHRQGNQTLVQRANGPSALYTQQGPWEKVEYSNGVYGMRYYDDGRGITQFDFINPNMGVRTFGENPYEENDYGQGWSQRVPLW